jgi:hypothetical protein
LATWLSCLPCRNWCNIIIIAVHAVAKIIAASFPVCSFILVDAGKHAKLPDFAFGKDIDFLAVSQQVAPLDLSLRGATLGPPWDASC